MPIINEGASADVTLSGNCTLTINNPQGYCTVEFPIGTRIYAGGQADLKLDLNNGTARIAAVTGPVRYEVAADPVVDTQSPVSGAVGAARKVDNRNRIYFDGAALSAWEQIAGVGSIVETRPAAGASGPFLGRLITLTQTGAGTSNKLRTPYVPLTGLTGVGSPWFFTAELEMQAGAWATIEVRDEGSSNFLYLQIGLPDNQIRLSPYGGAQTDATPAGFSQAGKFRVLVHVTPTSNVGGTIRVFVYSQSGAVRTHSQTYSGNVIPSRVLISQQSNAANVLKVERFICAGQSAVMNGCSLEAGYNGWNMAPSIPIGQGLYDIYSNPANMLASRVNGGDREHGANDWYINHAIGGYRVDQMRADFQAWVLDLLPKMVIIGSPTNSMLAAMSQGSPTAYMATAKSLYLEMIDMAVAAGVPCVCIGVAPRNDSTTVSLGLALYQSLAADWRTWAAAAIPAHGATYVDVWPVVDDPASPGRLVAWADAGDGVHWTSRAKGAVMDAVYRAIA